MITDICPGGPFCLSHYAVKDKMVFFPLALFFNLACTYFISYLVFQPLQNDWYP